MGGHAVLPRFWRSTAVFVKMLFPPTPQYAGAKKPVKPVFIEKTQSYHDRHKTARAGALLIGASSSPAPPRPARTYFAPP